MQTYLYIFVFFLIMDITEVLSAWGDKAIPFLRTIIIVVVVFIIFNFIFMLIKRGLLKRAKTKKQISNVEIFSRVIKYLFIVILLLIAIFSYSGSWTGFGLSVGLMSAALGWALQRPITGIAGWILVIVKRPFEIGDRIIIGGVKGDVVDITLNHIYISEVGGLVGGEENSGRTVMIPNAKLFEQDITNYTLHDDYILDQVAVTVTYECNLDHSIKIALDAAKKHTKEFAKHVKKEPYVLTYFEPNGVNVRARYLAPAKRLQEISSRITKEIKDKITEAKDVEIAYPHTEVVLRQKTGNKDKKIIS